MGGKEIFSSYLRCQWSSEAPIQLASSTLGIGACLMPEKSYQLGDLVEVEHRAPLGMVCMYYELNCFPSKSYVEVPTSVPVSVTQLRNRVFIDVIK